MSAIHATALSMSSRFTMMQKIGASASKREQQVLLVSNTGTSVANRSLLNQLEQKHQMGIALKIKRKRLNARPTAIIESRQAQNRGSMEAAKEPAIGASSIRERLRRLSKASRRISTLTADLLKKSPRSGGDSTSNISIADRLGVRSGARSRARSMSRKSQKSNQNLMQRSTSQARIRGRSASRQRRNPQTRLNQMQLRSNSRINSNGNEQPSQNRRRLIGRSSRSSLRKVRSVIERLNVRRGGINATQPNANGKNKQIRRDGIAKRDNSSVRNRPVNAGKQEAAGLSSSRTPQKALRKRGNEKKQQQRQRQSGNRDLQLARARSKNRYGRGHSKRRRARAARLAAAQVAQVPQVAQVARVPPKSIEELDKELEQYMANIEETSMDVSV